MDHRTKNTVEASNGIPEFVPELTGSNADNEEEKPEGLKKTEGRYIVLYTKSLRSPISIKFRKYSDLKEFFEQHDEDYHILTLAHDSEEIQKTFSTITKKNDID